MMNKTGLNDPRLSFKAKGILAYLMSKPDNWKVVVQDLVNNSADGRDSVYSGINELKRYGYLEKYPVRENGKILHWESIVYETPIEVEPEEKPTSGKSGSGEKPFPDFPEMENPDMENPERNNNDYNNNYSNYNNNNNTDPKGTTGEKKEDTEEVTTDFVVVVKELKQKINKVVGKISNDQLINLINKVGIDKINEYIEKYPEFEKVQEILNPVGFFISAILGEWSVPISSKPNKINNFNSFEQHDYSENDLEHLFEPIG